MNAATLGEVPAENMGSPGSSVLLRPVKPRVGSQALPYVLQYEVGSLCSLARCVPKALQ